LKEYSTLILLIRTPLIFLSFFDKKTQLKNKKNKFRDAYIKNDSETSIYNYEIFFSSNEDKKRTWQSPTPYPGLATGPTNYCIIKNVILSKNFIMSHILQQTHYIVVFYNW